MLRDLFLLHPNSEPEICERNPTLGSEIVFGDAEYCSGGMGSILNTLSNSTTW